MLIGKNKRKRHKTSSLSYRFDIVLSCLDKIQGSCRVNTIIKENAITFKELEQKIFKDICKIGQECIREFLEWYDQMLMKNCDRSKYRTKDIEEDGLKHCVFLLDETLELDHIGFISTNMAEFMVKSVTEKVLQR